MAIPHKKNQIELYFCLLRTRVQDEVIAGLRVQEITPRIKMAGIAVIWSPHTRVRGLGTRD